MPVIPAYKLRDSWEIPKEYMVRLKKSKKAIIKKAGELGTEYAEKYKGCGQCTYMAIIDSLRWGGYEILPREIEDRVFSGICVLTGGVGMTGEGSCGAVASSAICIGMALDLQTEGQDDSHLRAGLCCRKKHNTR